MQLRSLSAAAERSPLEQKVGAQQHKGAEVEVVAQAARLIVDGRMAHHLAALFAVAVAVEHGSTRVGSHAHHALYGEMPERDGSCRETEQSHVGLHRAGHKLHRCRAVQAVGCEKNAVGRSLVCRSKSICDKEEDAPHRMNLAQLTHQGRCCPYVVAGQKAIGLAMQNSVFFHHLYYNICAKIRFSEGTTKKIFSFFACSNISQPRP